MNPPLGLFNLNGHKKLLASLKWGPQETISWIRSYIQIIPNLPKAYEIILLSDKGILDPFILPKPLLNIKCSIVNLEGYPTTKKGRTLFNILQVALLTLMKVALLIYLNLNSLRIFFTLGLTF